MAKVVALIAAGILILLQLSHCINSRSPSDAAVHIDPSAISIMSPDQYPKMLERLGPEGFTRANSKMRDAGLYAAKLGGCPMVEYVGVSDQSTPDDVEYFVDCKDGGRVRVSEHDLP